MSTTVLSDSFSAIIDRLMDAYLSWREACVTVQHEYERWCAAARVEHVLAHAAYVAALEREEHAAACYQRHLDQIVAELAAG